jgi:hypothetical protein
MIHEHVAGDLLVFWSMLRGGNESPVWQPTFRIASDVFDLSAYPCLYFVEQSYPGERPTADSRSAGFVIVRITARAVATALRNVDRSFCRTS